MGIETRSSRRMFWVALLCMGFAACSSRQKVDSPFVSDTISGPQQLFLDDSNLRSQIIREFIAKHPSPTEKDKIFYLIDQVRISNRTFVRNGVFYNSKQAADLLWWKSQHRQFGLEPIHTAREFVQRMASFSSSSGRLYQVILNDGRYYALGPILNNELDVLEAQWVEGQWAAEKSSPKANA